MGFVLCLCILIIELNDRTETLWYYTQTHSRTQIYNWSLLSIFNYMAMLHCGGTENFRLGNLIIRLLNCHHNVLFFEIIQV